MTRDIVWLLGYEQTEMLIKKPVVSMVEVVVPISILSKFIQLGFAFSTSMRKRLVCKWFYPDR